MEFLSGLLIDFAVACETKWTITSALWGQKTTIAKCHKLVEFFCKEWDVQHDEADMYCGNTATSPECLG